MFLKLSFQYYENNVYISLSVNSLDMKLRATTLLNSRLQEIDLIVTMTVIYILIICEGVVSEIYYLCPFDRNYV